MIELRLRDSTPALIWPLLASDGRGLRQAFAELSADARAQRFLSGIRNLDSAMLKLLVDDVDGVRHVALILVALPETGAERPVGVARLIQDATDPAVAHIAFTVADDWRGRGVGAALGRALLDRRPPEVRWLQADVAAENAASLALLRRLGHVTSRFAEAGVISAKVDLSDCGPASGR